MLMRNLDPSNGLCNGTRLMVVDLKSNVILSRFIAGNNNNKCVIIPRITLTTTSNKFPFELNRKQFPIRLCYAMTINKSQGQTLNNIGIYLHNDIFLHGQLYVALSRATNPNNIIIYNTDNNKRIVKNPVYKSIFDN